MAAVATISAADPEIGKLIAEAVKEVGKGGVVTVQEGGTETTVEYKEGMEIDRGYIHPYLVTNLERQEAVLDSRSSNSNGHEVSQPVYVVVLNEVSDNQMLVTLLKTILGADNQARILIVAKDYLPEAMESIVRTKMNGMRLAAIKCPEFGEHQLNLMEDIALVTGGVVIGGESGLKAEEVQASQIGTCDRVVVADNKTTIIGGHAKENDKEDYLVGLQNKLAIAKTDGLKDKLESRIARISGGVAIISVGGTSEPEIVERKERVYDAVNATKAAVDEGIVPGGGTALLLAGQSLSRLREAVDRRYLPGVDIVLHAIHAPFERLIHNAGQSSPDVVLAELNKFDKPMVWDVETNSAVDPYEAGIIDPVKVTRTALVHAESIASILITMECMIAYDRDVLPKEAQMTELHNNRSFNSNT
jgi:chaperonin GroEL